MIKVLEFCQQLASVLPETDALLRSSNLTVHPSVSSIVLHGSRGLANRYRPDSDIDLSLIVDSEDLELLQVVYETTRGHWSSNIELDLALVFDIHKCQLRCFDQNIWKPDVCVTGGVDCFGLYKMGKGFNGRIANAGIQVQLMYPCIKIWERG